MLEITPIIHARTKNMDYPANFMVRPKDFTKADIAWTSKRILTATTNVEFMENERWIILKNKQRCIAGAVILIKDLYEKSSTNKTEADKKYFKDGRGRTTLAFIGLSIIGEKFDSVIDIDYDCLWKIYKNYIADIWEENIQLESQLASSLDNSDFVNVPFREIDEPIQAVYTKNHYAIYNSEKSMDKKLFNYYLNKALAGTRLTFCSNLNSPKAVKTKVFSIITASRENISAYKKYYDNPTLREPKNVKIQNNINDDESELTIKERLIKARFNKFNNEKKNAKNKMWIVIGLIIILLLKNKMWIVVGLIILLLMIILLQD